MLINASTETALIDRH